MPTYTFDDAAGTPKDYVRMRIGDTTSSPRWFLSDQMIDSLLARFSVNEACAQAAESIAAQCREIATKTDQASLSLEYADRAKTMFELADRLRNMAVNLTTPNPGAVVVQLAAPDLSNYPLGLSPLDPNQTGKLY